MVEYRQISTGSAMEADFAYARAVVKGDWCFVSGVTGYDYATMAIPDAPADQAEQCFQTITSVLTEAGFSMGDIVRVQYTVTDRAFVEGLAPVLQRHLGEVRPAATMIIADLIAPDMKVEIEVTAYRG